MPARNLSILASSVLAFSLIGGFAPPADAGDKLPFAAEVDSCLAAVNARVATGTANRVRHLVSNAKPTGIGYVLTIETAVFFDDSQKRYEAYCVANGDNTPFTLRIEEV